MVSDVLLEYWKVKELKNERKIGNQVNFFVDSFVAHLYTAAILPPAGF